MSKKSSKLLAALFDLDNPIMIWSAKTLDLVLLNLLFVLTCLPLVTVGMSKLALYRTLWTRRTEPGTPVWSTYWQALGQEWRQGLVLGLLEGGLVAVCLVNVWLLSQQDGGLPSLIKVLALAVLFLTTIVFLYAYPLAAKYELGLQELLIKSFLLAGINSQWTLLFMLVLLAIFGLLTMISSLVLLSGLSALIFFGLAGLAQLQLGLLAKIFEKYHD